MAFKRIGFIGLGAMGLPMARNLLRRGYEVHLAVHRNPEPVRALEQEGAAVHDSVVSAAAACDALISILPTDREMESVLLEEKLLEAAGGIKLLIEMTSGSPAMMKRVQAEYSRRGVPVLDAPVSGGTAGAENGTLTVMAGGDAGTLEEAEPVLQAVAANIFHVGPAGAGKAIKAINQMLAGVHMIAAAEALALAGKLGIDGNALKQVIGNSSGMSWMLLNKLDAMAGRDFRPGFKERLMRKDVAIAVEEGRQLPLPLASLALQLYTMKEKEIGDLDFSAIALSILGDD